MKNFPPGPGKPPKFVTYFDTDEGTKKLACLLADVKSLSDLSAIVEVKVTQRALRGFIGYGKMVTNTFNGNRPLMRDIKYMVTKTGFPSRLPLQVPRAELVS